MTVCIMARYDSGLISASDSAIVTGGNRVTLPYIKGAQIPEGYALYAGVLHEAQRIIQDVRLLPNSLIDTVRTAAKERDEEDDGADFLLAQSPRDFCSLDSDGAVIWHEDWGCIGHGADSARMLLEALYKKKGLEYVKTTLKTIITIIAKYDNTVFGPVRFEVWPDDA